MVHNQFSPAFSVAFDPEDETGPGPIPPSRNGMCYPSTTDWSCAYSQDELDTMRSDPAVLKVMQRAEALAWYTLASLTAYQIGVCPSVVRPCAARCAPAGTWMVSTVRASGYSALPLVSIGSFTPHVGVDGQWVNSCGCNSAADCSCSALCEAILPGPVGSIESVRVDGVTLAATAYRVDNGDRLVRTDGACWPVCQDFASSDPGVGFWVTYYRGSAPNALTEYAAGVLATEFFKACSGGKCRLPSGVTSVTRQGVSYQIVAGSFPGGFTGIHEVDAVIRIYNPNGLTTPSRVISPDRRAPRQTTWVHS